MVVSALPANLERHDSPGKSELVEENEWQMLGIVCHHQRLRGGFS
jgi:hypothetical protein